MQVVHSPPRTVAPRLRERRTPPLAVAVAGAGVG